MAGSLSDYAENKVAEHLVGKTAFTMPTIYVALLTAAPNESASGDEINEVADAYSYARVATAGGDWSSAVAGAISNSSAITFPQASGGSWGTITHYALMDSGNWGEGYMIGWGDLSASQVISDGSTASFAIGALDLVVT